MKSISYYAVIGVFKNKKKIFHTAKTLKKAISIAYSITGTFQFYTFYIVHHTIEYESYIAYPASEDYDISNPLAVITIEDSIAFTSGKGKKQEKK